MRGRVGAGAGPKGGEGTRSRRAYCPVRPRTVPYCTTASPVSPVIAVAGWARARRLGAPSSTTSIEATQSLPPPPSMCLCGWAEGRWEEGR